MSTAPLQNGGPAACLYVSGYGPVITCFAFDLATGALAEQGRTVVGGAPSYLALAPDGRALYAVDEADGKASQVIAFAIDPRTCALREINRQPSGGDGAPHLSVHPSGRFVAVAHYGSGHTSILPVGEDGALAAASNVQRGPDCACRRAHQAVFDASGAHLLVPCLGSDCVVQYRFEGGRLGLNDPPAVAVAGGPRHLALAPGERHAYVLSEHASTITSFEYDRERGVLSSPEVIDSSEVTPGASAHIAVHPSGAFLYASNRAENSIGWFSLDARGRPHVAAFERGGIDTPRAFTIEETGRYLIAANQHGAQDVIVFRIDEASGRLVHAGSTAVGGHPTSVAVWLRR